MNNNTFERSRVIGFSDAVFSIAMTLLVLEVAIPTYRSVNEAGTWGVLAERIPNFIGFVVSFFVTAFYWIDYLRITRFIRDFNLKTIWLNIFLLFFVVLLPFSTAFYVNGINFIEPFVFYAVNLALIALMLLIFVFAIAKKEKGESGMSRHLRDWEATKLVNTTLIWVIAAILAFVNINIARIIFVLIFIINPFIDRYYKRKVISSDSKN